MVKAEQSNRFQTDGIFIVSNTVIEPECIDHGPREYRGHPSYIKHIWQGSR